MKTWCPGESDAGASLRRGARLLSGLLSSSAAHVRNALLMGTLQEYGYIYAQCHANINSAKPADTECTTENTEYENAYTYV